MARTNIKLEFEDKTYIIEFNRSSVRDFLKIKEADPIDQAIHMIKVGLKMHHANEMPDDDQIFGWVMAMGDDMKEFGETLQTMVQEVLETFKQDRKNLKWGKVEA